MYFDSGSVDNQEVIAVACHDLSCRDDTIIDLIKIVFLNNLFGYLYIVGGFFKFLNLS